MSADIHQRFTGDRSVAARRRRRTLGFAAGAGLVALPLVVGTFGGPGGAVAPPASHFVPAAQLIALEMPPLPLPPAATELGGFLDRWCLGCHAGGEPEGGLDLTRPVATLSDPARSPAVEPIELARVMRQVRRRLADGSMPPSRRRPDDAGYRTAVAATDAVLADLAGRRAMQETLTGMEAAARGIRSAPVRRLTRLEYAAAIRDLLGVDFDPARLPADEIGHGFDTNGDTLALGPLRFEQYVDAAERIARDAVVAAGRDRTQERRTSAELEIRGGGRANGSTVVLFSVGAAVARFDVPVPGRYRVVAAVAGDQAGPEPVRMQLRIAGDTRLVEQEIEGQMEPGRLETTLDLDVGPFVVEAAFVNDYYDRDAEDPADRDRNAVVAWIELDGPLSPPEPTTLQRRLAARFGAGADAESWRAAVVHVAGRAWRRPLTRDEGQSLVQAVEAAADAEAAAGGATPTAEVARSPGGIDPRRLRIGITAILAHPRFLFRIEADPEDAPVRALDGAELATRLSLLLWSSVPDESLMAAVKAGELGTFEGRRRAVDRLLRDPRSLAVSEHFAAQWLRIRSLEDRRPDADRFPGVDASLREAMRMETVLLFDALLREDRPVSELLTTRETFVNEPLARHYGIPGVRGPHMRRVSLDGMRGGAMSALGAVGEEPSPAGLGVLRHASILLTTSNPTRTSPVKRGKWVLESLLDDPPPPAPAFVPALPRDGEPTEHESLRDLLEQHRQDPSCAACHRRMDPLGFALEPFDAVGRPRALADGAEVDASAELPDGTRFDGPAGLRDLLVGARRPDLVRSLLRHLAIYALGRGLDPADDAWIEPALARLPEDPTIRALLLTVIESPPFRYRFAPATTPATTPTTPPTPRSPGDDA